VYRPQVPSHSHAPVTQKGTMKVTLFMATSLNDAVARIEAKGFMEATLAGGSILNETSIHMEVYGRTPSDRLGRIS
jgi:hypothetical protein